MKEAAQLSRVRRPAAAAGQALYALSPKPLPFALDLEIRSFLLLRESGNLILYGTATTPGDVATVNRHGGATRRYLSHRHEAAFLSGVPFAPVYCHESELTSVARRHDVGGTFRERHVVDTDFEVIPVPGHTQGATAYLWTSGERRLLFTGDAIYLDKDEWVATVLPRSDRQAYLESLQTIRNLDFDVLVPWAATSGRPWCAFTDRADSRRRIDAIIARVRRGEDR